MRIERFLLQKPPRKVSVMTVAVVEVDAVRHVGDLQPHPVSRVQIQSRLERELAPLISGRVGHPAPAVQVAVQVNADAQPQFVRRGERELSQSRERKEAPARSGRREYPRCQIHGPSDVHLVDFERHRNARRREGRVLLDVEIRGRRFDIGESKSQRLLETFVKIEFNDFKILIPGGLKTKNDKIRLIPGSFGNFVKLQ